MPDIVDLADGSMRARIVPMIADALERLPLAGLDVTGWDFAFGIGNGALMAGVAIAVKGYDVIGPGKELAQFEPLPSWNPTQEQVDQVVARMGDGLRAWRDNQKGMLHRG